LIRLTAGEDVQLDRRLAAAGALGSIAHAQMLNSIGILTRGVQGPQGRASASSRTSSVGSSTYRAEDVHTAIEERLTEKVGEAGKKIHTARCATTRRRSTVGCMRAASLIASPRDMTSLIRC
jgi:argininosuccinate lyase